MESQFINSVLDFLDDDDSKNFNFKNLQEKSTTRDEKMMSIFKDANYPLRTIDVVYKGEKRYAMSIGDLASYFAKVKRPYKMAGKHARNYARDKKNNNEWYEGVYCFQRSIFMVLELYEKYVHSHFGDCIPFPSLEEVPVIPFINKYIIRDNKVKSMFQDAGYVLRTIQVTYEGKERCAMAIADLASYFAKVKYPSKMAGIHARKYAKNKDNNEWYEGVYCPTGKLTFMILEAYEMYVHIHFEDSIQLPPLE